jgi:hypothetical protein
MGRFYAKRAGWAAVTRRGHRGLASVRLREKKDDDELGGRVVVGAAKAATLPLARPGGGREHVGVPLLEIRVTNSAAGSRS